MIVKTVVNGHLLAVISEISLKPEYKIALYNTSTDVFLSVRYMSDLDSSVEIARHLVELDDNCVNL